MENNKKKPSFPALEKICGAFNITLKEFFDDGNDDTLSPDLRKLIVDIKEIDPHVRQNIINLVESIRISSKFVNKL